MPHYDELYPSRFTKGTQLPGPLTVRIVALGGEELEGEDGTKSKAVLRYRAPGPDGTPVEGEMVWAKTNSRLAAAIFGTDDYRAWVGHTITVKHDPDVDMGGERVGGIRVCGSPELKKTITVKIKRPRRKKVEVYVLHPTEANGRTKGAAPAPTPTPDREPGADDAPAGEPAP